jgi:hypothetical protein
MNQRFGPREQFQNPIRRPGSYDLKNERLARVHVTETDG